MRYHDITTDDMLNGDGLRTVLWVAGCEHHCFGCQNPITWDENGGLEFDEAAKEELLEKLKPDYISGVTFSGGDPLHPANCKAIWNLCLAIRSKFPQKTIWIYSGYTWEEVLLDVNRILAVCLADVLVDGRFNHAKMSLKYPWAGSTNQRVIDIQKSFEAKKVFLYSEPGCNFDISGERCTCDT